MLKTLRLLLTTIVRCHVEKNKTYLTNIKYASMCYLLFYVFLNSNLQAKLSSNGVACAFSGFLLF